MSDNSSSKSTSKLKRNISKAARERIAAAQRRRWIAYRLEKKQAEKKQVAGSTVATKAATKAAGDSQIGTWRLPFEVKTKSIEPSSLTDALNQMQEISSLAATLPTPTNLADSLEPIFRQILEIVRRKNYNYTRVSNPLGNFLAVTEKSLGRISAVDGLLTRLSDKEERRWALINRRTWGQYIQDNESLVDTIHDEIAYLAILIVLLEKESAAGLGLEGWKTDQNWDSPTPAPAPASAPASAPAPTPTPAPAKPANKKR